MGAMRFGTPWRSCFGYINGYSERSKVFIPAQKVVRRNLHEISNRHKVHVIRICFAALIFLIGTQRYSGCICCSLQCRPSGDSAGP